MRRNRKRAEIEPNLTSLIDVTFLLIVFFVLVSHLAQQETASLDLPKPHNPATLALEAEHQVAITVLPGAGGVAAGYRIGGTDLNSDRAGVDALTAQMVELYQANPRININVRADRGTSYEYVEPVMEAVATAARRVPAVAAVQGGAARVNLVVVKEE